MEIRKFFGRYWMLYSKERIIRRLDAKTLPAATCEALTYIGGHHIKVICECGLENHKDAPMLPFAGDIL